MNVRRDLIHVDLVVAHQALDRLTDTLLKDMGQAYRNEVLTRYCAQMRGELCAYFNGISLLLDDYHDGIESTR